MAIVYAGGALVILLAHLGEIPALWVIFRVAFTGQAVTGGALGTVIQKGISRGVFSNEAGLGTAPIAQAAAKPGDPVLHGTLAMLGTVIVCTMTALVIVISGLCTGEQSGVALTMAAFDEGLPDPPGS